MNIEPFVSRYTWLQERIRLCAPHWKPRDRAQVHGLVLLDVGQTVKNVLSPINMEERFLLEFLGWTSGIVMLRVVAAVELQALPLFLGPCMSL